MTVNLVSSAEEIENQLLENTRHNSGYALSAACEIIVAQCRRIAELIEKLEQLESEK